MLCKKNTCPRLFNHKFSVADHTHVWLPPDLFDHESTQVKAVWQLEVAKKIRAVARNFWKGWPRWHHTSMRGAQACVRHSLWYPPQPQFHEMEYSHIQNNVHHTQQGSGSVWFWFHETMTVGGMINTDFCKFWEVIKRVEEYYTHVKLAYKITAIKISSKMWAWLRAWSESDKATM